MLNGYLSLVALVVHICNLYFLVCHADMTIYQKMHCPECGNTDILKAGFTAKEKNLIVVSLVYVIKAIFT